MVGISVLRLRMIAVPVFAMLWAVWVGVNGYSDVRQTPCMSDSLTTKIPKNRSKWSGVIEMHMECDTEYDFPLNTPEGGVFKCRPDGKSWEPHYVPDCNKKEVPTKINIVLGILMDSPATCNSASTAGGQTINLGGSFQEANVASLCQNEAVGFKNCDVTITKVCSGHVDKQAEAMTAEDYWINDVRADDTTSPFVAAIIKADYGTDTKKGRELMTAVDTLNNKVKAAMGASDVKAKLKADCSKGSLGVMDNNDGSILCRGCSLGHYLDQKDKTCKMCEPGKYSDEVLQVTCKTCPALYGVETTSDVWGKINDKYQKGAYSLIYCPSLNKQGKVMDPYQVLGKPRILNNSTKMSGSDSDSRSISTTKANDDEQTDPEVRHEAMTENVSPQNKYMPTTMFLKELLNKTGNRQDIKKNGSETDHTPALLPLLLVTVVIGMLLA